MVEPLPIVPHCRQPFLGLGDAVAKTFIDDQFDRHAQILQPLVQFVGIGFIECGQYMFLYLETLVIFVAQQW